MTSATTVNDEAPVSAPRLLGLYLLLILIAAIEAFDGLSHVPALFGDMHFTAFRGWHITAHFEWNFFGVAVTFLLGLSLSALAVNRANRPVTRWCRHVFFLIPRYWGSAPKMGSIAQK